MNNSPRSVILLTKDDEWGARATSLVSLHFPGEVTVFRGKFGTPYPLRDKRLTEVILISFLSPWIVPADHIDSAWIAVNFHPGSTSYPGIGCYNFALYENAKEYGAVFHFMSPLVDRGEIIEERLFGVEACETVASLRNKTLETMTSMLQDVLPNIRRNQRPKSTDNRWRREPFKRKDLEELSKVTINMDSAEIGRRVRAMHYPGYPGAWVRIGATVFRAEFPTCSDESSA